MGMNLAAQICAWGKRWPSAGYGLPQAPVGVPPITFPATKLGIRPEFYVDGEWRSVPERVYYLDGNAIVISRGRGNERGTAPPSTCGVTLKNFDRKFSPRNVAGEWFGKFGRNTRFRLWVNPGSGDSLRYTGRVPDWTPVWTTGDDRSVRIEASGVLRQLEQGTAPINSPMHNNISTDTTTARYYSLEDEEGSESFASNVGGGLRGQFSAVNLATNSTLTGSKPLPTLETSGFIDIPIGWTPPNGRWQVDWHYNLPSDPGADTSVMEWHSVTGTALRWQLVILSGGTSFAVRAYARDATLLVNSSFAAPAGNPVVGAFSHWSVYIQQNGANVDWAWKFFPSLGGDGATASGSYAGTVGNISRMHVPSATAVNGLTVGHWVIYDAFNYTQPGLPAFGYVAERPTDRFLRAAGEAGISAVVRELVVDGQRMGAQPISDTVSIFRESESVNGGVIDEATDGDLRLNSRTIRYNAAYDLIVDYSQVGDLKPTDDDFALRNDWTVTRSGGSSARAVQTSGPNNISEPEDDAQGVGHRPDSTSLNVRLDSQTDDQAWWRVAQGTVDQLRYKKIRIDLHLYPELIPMWLACDVGSRIRIDNPPTDVGPGPIDQFIEGITEIISQFTWTVELVTSPSDAFNVAVISATTPRLDCGATTLAEALDTTETDLDVAIADTCHWVVSDGSYVIRIGGEDMLLTAVSVPAGSVPSRTQTLTVERSYNGAALEHAAGAEVHVKYPIRLAL